MNAINFLKFLKEQPEQAALSVYKISKLCQNIKKSQKTNYKEGTVITQMILSKRKIFFS